MAVIAERVTVGTSPTLLVGNFRGGVAIKAASDIYLGGDDVTTSNGFLLAAGQVYDDIVRPSDYLYGRVASSTVEASVIKSEGAGDR